MKVKAIQDLDGIIFDSNDLKNVIILWIFLLYNNFIYLFLIDK